MKHYRTSIYIIAGLVLSTIPARGLQEKLSLFTEEQAQKLRIEADAWDPVPRARSATLGPLIVVHAPQVARSDRGDETIETSSPTQITVVFEENQAPVNMGSLDIRAKKGLFSMSLNDVLRPYVAGTTLEVDSVDVPSGKYQIQIAVEDLEGHETTRTFRFIVEE